MKPGLQALGSAPATVAGALEEVADYTAITAPPSFVEQDGEVWSESSAEGALLLPKWAADLPHITDKATGERLSILEADAAADLVAAGWVAENGASFSKSAGGSLIVSGTYNAWLRTAQQDFSVRGIWRILLALYPATSSPVTGTPGVCVWGANQGPGGSYAGSDSGLWLDLTSGASGGQQRARLTTHDRAPLNAADLGPVDWSAGKPLLLLVDWTTQDGIARYGQTWLRGNKPRRAAMDRTYHIFTTGYDGQIWLVPGMYLTGAGEMRLSALGIFNATSLTL